MPTFGLKQKPSFGFRGHKAALAISQPVMWRVLGVRHLTLDSHMAWPLTLSPTGKSVTDNRAEENGTEPTVTFHLSNVD